MTNRLYKDYDSPIFPFKHVDLEAEPKDEIDLLLRQIIEYTRLKRRGYESQEIMTMTGFPKLVRRLMGLNRSLLLTLEERVFSPEQILLIARLYPFMLEEHIFDLVEAVAKRRATAGKIVEETEKLLRHYAWVKELRRAHAS